MASRLFYEHTIASLASRRDFDRDAYYDEISTDESPSSNGRTSPVRPQSPKKSSAVDDRSVVSSKSSEVFRRNQKRTATQDVKSSHRGAVDHGSPRRRTPVSANPPRTGSGQTRPVSPSFRAASPHKGNLKVRPSSPSKLSYPAMDDSPPIRVYTKEPNQSAPQRKTDGVSSRKSPLKTKGPTSFTLEEKAAPGKSLVKPSSGVAADVSSAEKETPIRSDIDDELDGLLGDEDKPQSETGSETPELDNDKAPDTSSSPTAVANTDISETAEINQITTPSVNESDSPVAGLDSSENDAVESADNNKVAMSEKGAFVSSGEKSAFSPTAEEGLQSRSDMVNGGSEPIESSHVDSGGLPPLNDGAKSGQEPEQNPYCDQNREDQIAETAKQVAIQEPPSRSSSYVSSPDSEDRPLSNESGQSSSRKGILQSILKTEKSASRGNQKNRKKVTKPVQISCKFNPSRGFSDFQVRKHKKVYKGLVELEKGKVTPKALSRIIIEELFERDFWPGKHWEIDTARVWECSGSEHPSFNAEKLATWDWKDIYSEASATAVIRFLPDRILIEDYAYYVAG